MEPRDRKRQREERVALAAQHEVKRYCTEQSQFNKHVANLRDMLNSPKYSSSLEDRAAVIIEFLNYLKVHKGDIMSLCNVDPLLRDKIIDTCKTFRNTKDFPDLVAVATELLHDFSD